MSVLSNASDLVKKLQCKRDVSMGLPFKGCPMKHIDPKFFSPLCISLVKAPPALLSIYFKLLFSHKPSALSQALFQTLFNSCLFFSSTMKVSLFLAAACATAAAVPELPVWTRWCDSNLNSTDTRCKDDGDAGGMCSAADLICVCSEGYGPLYVDGEWKYFGCYEELREAYISLTFASGSCETDGTLPPNVRSGVVDAVQTALPKSVVTSLSHVCNDITIFMTVDVPALKAASVTSALSSGIHAALSTAAKAELGDTAPVVDAVVGPSMLPPSPAVYGSTNAPPTLTPRLSEGPATCHSIPTGDTLVAFTVDISGESHCSAVRCAQSYGLEMRGEGSNMTGFVCAQTSSHTTCLVSGDCTANTLKTACQNEVCVEPAAPSKNTSLAARPTSVVENACLTDSDCGVGGTCNTTREVQGNYCICGEGYEVSSASLAVCVVTGSTSVQLTYNIDFPNGPCSTWDKLNVKQQMREVIEESLGPLALMKGACGSVSVMGSAHVTRENAEKIASGEISVVAVVNKNIADKGSADLSDLGEATRAEVGNGASCVSEGAVLAIPDIHDRCQAVQCESTHTLVKEEELFSCSALTAEVPSSDDDDLTSVERGLIGIGVVSGVFLIGIIIIAVKFCSCGSKDSSSSKETTNEPTENA